MGADPRMAPTDRWRWARELPEGWEAVNLKRVADISASNVDKKTVEGEQPVRLCNYTDVYYNDFVTPDLDFMAATATGREISRFRLRGGEVLLTKDSETAEDIAIPAYVPESLGRVLCGYHLYVVRARPDRLDGRYLHRATSVSPVRDQFVVGANGITRYGLGQQELGEALIPLPPLPLQRAVSDFLDRETAKIDDLIGEKQRLLDLLNEKRTALIARAVTKGLDPNVPLKDSGVPWIGQIPVHWQVLRMRFLCEITTGSGDTQDAVEEGPYPFFVRSDNIESASEYSFDGEAVLTSGDGAGVGKIFHHHLGKLHFHQRVYLFHSFRRVMGRYLYYFARQHLSNVVLDGSAKSTVDSIRRPMLANFPIAFGPESEQAQIVEYLDRSTQEIDSLIDLLKSQIGKLHEYQTALISAAVTGQIDVREAAA